MKNPYNQKDQKLEITFSAKIDCIITIIKVGKLRVKLNVQGQI